MNQKSKVKPEQWIDVDSRPSVVCTVYPDDERHKDTIEVVYLDRDRAINEDAFWKDGRWQFAHTGPCGGYADHSKRLSRYVAILRDGHPLKKPVAPMKSPSRRGRSASSSRTLRSRRS